MYIRVHTSFHSCRARGGNRVSSVILFLIPFTQSISLKLELGLASKPQLPLDITLRGDSASQKG